MAALAALNNHTFFSKQHKQLVLILLFQLTLIVTFLWHNPAVFNWDAVNRLIHHDKIFLEHWLPGLQVLIYLAYKLKIGLTGLRIVLILIAMGTTSILYLFISRQFTEIIATVTCLLFVTTPGLLTLASVPYQEMLMYLLIFTGLYLHLIKHDKTAFFILGMACMVRYEAWSICLLFVLREIYLAGRSSSVSQTAKRLVVTVPLICWGIAAVLLLRHLSIGRIVDYTALSDVPAGLSDLTRTAFLKIRENFIIFGMAVPGAIYCLFEKNEKIKKSLWLTLLFFLFFTLLFATVRASKAPSSFRTFSIPVAALVLFVPFTAGLLQRFMDKVRSKKLILVGNVLAVLALTFVIVRNINETDNLFKAICRYTFFDEYYAAGRAAKKHKGEKILIIEPENYLDAAVTSIYLDKHDNVSIQPLHRFEQSNIQELLAADFNVIINIGSPGANIAGIKDALPCMEQQIGNIQVIEITR